MLSVNITSLVKLFIANGFLIFNWMNISFFFFFNKWFSMKEYSPKKLFILSKLFVISISNSSFMLESIKFIISASLLKKKLIEK